VRFRRGDPARQAGRAKGTYLKKVTVTSTMGPGYKLDLAKLHESHGA